MPLSDPACSRRPVHTRSIRVASYARDDGLWDIEAELIDTKAYDFPIRGGGVLSAGSAVHHMRLRVTIDDKFTITAAEAVYDAAPYGEFCSVIAPDYSQLAGLNLLKQFRKSVRERFGRTAGCTHLTELTNVLPTVAVQTMAGRRRQQADNGERPFQLDGCHALRLDGAVVQQHYSPWYLPSEARSDEG